MKKLTALLMAVLLVLAVSGCKSQNEEKQEAVVPAEPTPVPAEYLGSYHEEIAGRGMLELKENEVIIDWSDSAFEKESLYKESKKISVLNFKNTTFLNESHMISRIPDEYKVEGKKFIMEDKNNTEYLVEWSEEPKILNTTKSNEQQARLRLSSFLKSLSFFTIKVLNIILILVPRQIT